MRLVGYTRVSSESQAHNTSLEEQRNKIESYAAAFDHELIAVFEEVGSGKNACDRPQFQAALARLIQEADGIIAAKLDRLARNTRDVLALVDDVLQPQGKALVLLDLQVDTTTPQGYLILTVLSAMAKLERDLINERTQGGRLAKARQGGYAYGAPPFGQVAVEGCLVTDVQEQTVIDLIRRHHKSGKSLRAIARYLNANAVPSKRGKPWSAVTVSAVLKRLYSSG
jgi:DNA invertase Pin-like site-specific DNA recombinase